MSFIISDIAIMFIESGKIRKTAYSVSFLSVLSFRKFAALSGAEEIITSTSVFHKGKGNIADKGKYSQTLVKQHQQQELKTSFQSHTFCFF